MLERLTPREREVISLMAKGFSDGEIAKIIFVEKSTVKTHIHCAFEKLELVNSTQEKHSLRLKASAVYWKETVEELCGCLKKQIDKWLDLI